ncbi:MAG: SRPBCC family protein [Anaerolineales bacterium]|jgi:carbon monoxide dehydrogenase subunit G|nr:SRPBCC family protein [Chloroflexota bacterium]MBK6647795.1 SRPBCC family protein [Anaerolineales bacterium]
MKLEKSIHINCTPEKAFAFATDFSNASKWMVGFIESKMLTEGATRVGTQYMFVSKMLGQKMEMKSEVTVWEPPARYEYKTVDAPISMHGGFTFTPKDGGTLVTMSGEGEFGGLFKLAEGMMKSQMDKQMDDTMQALKKALEG